MVRKSGLFRKSGLIQLYGPITWRLSSPHPEQQIVPPEKTAPGLLFSGQFKQLMFEVTL